MSEQIIASSLTQEVVQRLKNCSLDTPVEKLQEILDTTNYVAQKYHIEFGAAKCKVVRIGKGEKSKIRLNGQVLEEVPVDGNEAPPLEGTLHHFV